MKTKQKQLLITWQNQTGRKIEKNKIRSHLADTLRHLGLVDRLELEILIVGDEIIKKLNLTYRKINKPTDVLSFPLPKDLVKELAKSQTPKPRQVGSIVVSLDTAIRQSIRSGITVTDELKILCNHGLLHLLGFHHY